MDRTKAAEEFAKALFLVGVERSVEAFNEGLLNPGGKDKNSWELSRKLYEAQTDEGKAAIRFMIKEASVLSSFGIAVFLDGASGYYDTGGDVSQFTVVMNRYKNLEDVGIPLESIQVCPVKNEEDVHDIFMGLVDEAEAAGYPQATLFP